MSIRKKNNPGCPCCFCTCPDEVTEYQRFTRFRIEISGLAASYDYYNETQWDFGWVQTHEGTVTGLDAANGTYIIEYDSANAGCIVDDPGASYAVIIYEEIFTLYYTETRTRYFNFDCDPDVPAELPEGVEEITYEVEFKLVVTKEGEHWFRVQLFTVNGRTLLSGCQVFACENGFDATQNGTLTDSQKEHNALSFPDIDGELCSDGDIWFTPFSFSTNATSTICGVAREFADMEIVGAIAAETI